MNTKFSGVNTKFDEVDTKLNEVNTKFGSYYNKDVVDNKLNEVNTKFSGVNTKFDEVDTSLNVVNNRINGVELHNAKFTNGKYEILHPVIEYPESENVVSTVESTFDKNITFIYSKFNIILAFNDTDKVLIRSVDEGKSWSDVYSSQQTINYIGYENEMFICVGNAGLVITSDDLGIAWVEHTITLSDTNPEKVNILKVVYLFGKYHFFVQSGNGSISVLRVLDTLSSTTIKTPIGNKLLQGKYVVNFDNIVIFTSRSDGLYITRDGEVWLQLTPDYDKIPKYPTNIQKLPNGEYIGCFEWAIYKNSNVDTANWIKCFDMKNDYPETIVIANGYILIGGQNSTRIYNLELNNLVQEFNFGCSDCLVNDNGYFIIRNGSENLYLFKDRNLTTISMGGTDNKIKYTATIGAKIFVGTTKGLKIISRGDDISDTSKFTKNLQTFEEIQKRNFYNYNAFFIGTANNDNENIVRFRLFNTQYKYNTATMIGYIFNYGTSKSAVPSVYKIAIAPIIEDTLNCKNITFEHMAGSEGLQLGFCVSSDGALKHICIQFSGIPDSRYVFSGIYVGEYSLEHYASLGEPSEIESIANGGTY